MIKCDNCNEQGRVITEPFPGSYKMRLCDCEGAKFLSEQRRINFDKRYKQVKLYESTT